LDCSFLTNAQNYNNSGARLNWARSICLVTIDRLNTRSRTSITNNDNDGSSLFLAAGLSGAKPDPLILQGLTGALRSLDYLGLTGVQDALGHSDFSVRELGKGSQPIALFLQFEESKLNALGPLLAFMANSVITSLFETAAERKPVFLFLD